MPPGESEEEEEEHTVKIPEKKELEVSELMKAAFEGYDPEEIIQTPESQRSPAAGKLVRAEMIAFANRAYLEQKA